MTVKGEKSKLPVLLLKKTGDAQHQEQELVVVLVLLLLAAAGDSKEAPLPPLNHQWCWCSPSY